MNTGSRARIFRAGPAPRPATKDSLGQPVCKHGGLRKGRRRNSPTIKRPGQGIDMELTAVIDARSCAAGAGPTLTQAVVGPAGADSDCGFHHSRETRWIPDSRAVATQRTFRCSSTAVERSRQLFRLNAIRVLQGASSRRSTCLWLRKCALNPAKSARRARRAEPPADLRRRRRHPTAGLSTSR